MPRRRVARPRVALARRLGAHAAVRRARLVAAERRRRRREPRQPQRWRVDESRADGRPRPQWRRAAAPEAARRKPAAAEQRQRRRRGRESPPHAASTQSDPVALGVDAVYEEERGGARRAVQEPFEHGPQRDRLGRGEVTRGSLFSSRLEHRGLRRSVAVVVAILDSGDGTTVETS